jgi:hypothetical protein
MRPIWTRNHSCRPATRTRCWRPSSTSTSPSWSGSFSVLGVGIAKDLGLSHAEKGMMVATPVLAGPPDALAAGDSRLAGEHPAQCGGTRGQGSLRNRRGISAGARTRGQPAVRRARPATAGAAQSAHAVENLRRTLLGAKFCSAPHPVALEFGHDDCPDSFWPWCP